jgi:hypothetical protein
MTDTNQTPPVSSEVQSLKDQADLLKAKTELLKAQNEHDQASSPPNAAIKQEAATAKEEAELTKAKTELLKAQKEQDDTRKAANAAIKEEAATAKQQAELLKAKTELLKAQKDQDDANKALDAATLADVAEKARLGRLKDVQDARKALADSQKSADLAAAQAAIGTVTGSGIEGTVTVKNDAGKGEATLLAARAVAAAAARIAGILKDKVKDKEVVLFQSGDFPQFGNYRQFQLQLALLKQQFEIATTDATAILKPTAPPAARAFAAMDSIPPVTFAGVALDAVAKLGSYFMSNYEIGGVALTPDNDQLISAVAGALTNAKAVVLPGRRIPTEDEIVKLLADVPKAIADANHTSAELAQEAQSLRNDLAAAGKDEARKKPIAEALARCDQAIAGLKAALTKAGEVITALGVADAKGQILATRIAQEKAVIEKLASGLALIVDVRAMAGGYYTVRNLWTFLLCRIPFYAMGGAVVTYQLVDQSGAVQASGLVPVHGGYQSVNEVEKLFANP